MWDPVARAQGPGCYVYFSDPIPPNAVGEMVVENAWGGYMSGNQPTLIYIIDNGSYIFNGYFLKVDESEWVPEPQKKVKDIVITATKNSGYNVSVKIDTLNY